MVEHLTIEEINAAPLLRWKELDAWLEKIDLAAAILNNTQLECAEIDLAVAAVNLEYRKWQAAEEKMLRAPTTSYQDLRESVGLPSRDWDSFDADGNLL